MNPPKDISYGDLKRMFIFARYKTTYNIQNMFPKGTPRSTYSLAKKVTRSKSTINTFAKYRDLKLIKRTGVPINIVVLGSSFEFKRWTQIDCYHDSNAPWWSADYSLIKWRDDPGYCCEECDGPQINCGWCGRHGYKKILPSRILEIKTPNIQVLHFATRALHDLPEDVQLVIFGKLVELSWL